MRTPYQSAQRLTTVARNVLVTVELEGGIQGYGEAAPATYVTGETQVSVVQKLRDQAHLWIGRDVSDVDASVLGRTAVSEGWPGAGGALEMALADAVARENGRPFFDRDGTHFHKKQCSRATDLSLPILPYDETVRRAAEAAQSGFRSLKLKIGGGDIAADIARVRAVGEAAPGVSLRLDGNQGLTPDAALYLIGELGDLLSRIAFLEQPTRAGDDDAMRFVAERIPVPVFADESVHTAADARRLIDSGICRGLVLKVAKSGIAETEAIATVARDFGVPCLFGCMMETHIAIGAALRMAISFGTEIVPYLDLDGHLLVDDTDRVEGGFSQRGDILTVDPNQPGLDVHLRAVG